MGLDEFIYWYIGITIVAFIVMGVIGVIKDIKRTPNTMNIAQQPLPPSQRALLRLRRPGEELRDANDDLKRTEDELKHLDMHSQYMEPVDYEEQKRKLEIDLKFARERCAACEQEHNNALQEYRNN